MHAYAVCVVTQRDDARLIVACGLRPLGTFMRMAFVGRTCAGVSEKDAKAMHVV